MGTDFFSAGFVKPPPEITGMLLAMRKDMAYITSIYRITIHGGPQEARMVVWCYAKNEQGKRFVENPEAPFEDRRVARAEPEVIKVKNVPDFLKLDLYGEPLEKYGDYIKLKELEVTWQQ